LTLPAHSTSLSLLPTAVPSPTSPACRLRPIWRRRRTTRPPVPSGRPYIDCSLPQAPLGLPPPLAQEWGVGRVAQHPSPRAWRAPCPSSLERNRGCTRVSTLPPPFRLGSATSRLSLPLSFCAHARACRRVSMHLVPVCEPQPLSVYSGI
jgi:hypothetical protein